MGSGLDEIIKELFTTAAALKGFWTLSVAIPTAGKVSRHAINTESF